MPTINQLSSASSISPGDLLALFSQSNGDARKISVQTLLDFFQTSFASPTTATTIITPGTGFNYGMPTPVSQQQWVLIQPAGTLATGTVTLPLNTGCPDGLEVIVSTTQTITAFTLALNGASAGFGAPTTLAANAFFRMRFVQSQNSWYRIG